MSDLTAAKLKVVSTLRDAGMIHPHTGHEKVVLDALDGFASVVADIVLPQFADHVPDPAPYAKVDTRADEIADAENNHGQDNLTPTDKSTLLEMIDSYRKYTGLPSAEDLDAVAAEEAAREATRGPVAVTEDEPVEIEHQGYAIADDAPVEIEHEGYTVDDAVAQAEPETEAAAAETEEPVSETEQSEQEQPVAEPVSQVEEVADGY